MITPYRPATTIGPDNPRTQPTLGAMVAGVACTVAAGQHHPTCSAWPRVGVRGCALACKPQVRANSLNHQLFQDRGNDLQLTTTVRAALLVEREHTLEQLDPAHQHWAVVRAVRLAHEGRRFLGRRFRLLRYHQSVQLSVVLQHAMKANQV